MKGKQGTLSRPRFPYLVKIATNEYMHVESLPLLTPLSPNLIGGASCGLQGKNPKEDTGQGAPCLPAHGARPHHSQLIKAEALGGKASTGGWGEPCWEGEPDSERTLDLSKRGGI